MDCTGIPPLPVPAVSQALQDGPDQTYWKDFISCTLLEDCSFENEASQEAAQLEVAGAESNAHFKEQALIHARNAAVEILPSSEAGDSSELLDSSEGLEGSGGSKGGGVNKATREKLRRERLNDRFNELSALLDLKGPNLDKLRILSEAIRVLQHLQEEAVQLKSTNQRLHLANTMTSEMAGSILQARQLDLQHNQPNSKRQRLEPTPQLSQKIGSEVFPQSTATGEASIVSAQHLQQSQQFHVHPQPQHFQPQQQFQQPTQPSATSQQFQQSAQPSATSQQFQQSAQPSATSQQFQQSAQPSATSQQFQQSAQPSATSQHFHAQSQQQFQQQTQFQPPQPQQPHSHFQTQLQTQSQQQQFSQQSQQPYTPSQHQHSHQQQPLAHQSQQIYGQQQPQQQQAPQQLSQDDLQVKFLHGANTVPGVPASWIAPFPRYNEGTTLWIPPASLDTSQDHLLRPPVA